MSKSKSGNAFWKFSKWKIFHFAFYPDLELCDSAKVRIAGKRATLKIISEEEDEESSYEMIKVELGVEAASVAIGDMPAAVFLDGNLAVSKDEGRQCFSSELVDRPFLNFTLQTMHVWTFRFLVRDEKKDRKSNRIITQILQNEHHLFLKCVSKIY